MTQRSAEDFATTDPENNSLSVSNDEQPKTLPLRFSHYCQCCDIFFHDIFAMEMHEFKVHKNVPNPSVCQECNDIFATDDLLNEHIHEEHQMDTEDDEESDGKGESTEEYEEESEEECDDNSGDESTEESTEVEDESDSDMDYTIQNDRKLTPIMTRLWDRQKKVRVCNLCLKSFGTKQDLLRHSAEKHRTKVLRCKECNFVSQKKHQLIQHQSVHQSGDQTYICDTNGCQQSYKSNKYLEEHKRKVHNVLKVYKCSFCNFETTKSVLLIRHETTHDQNRAFKCQFPGCEYRAKNYPRMQEHSKGVHRK